MKEFTNGSAIHDPEIDQWTDLEGFAAKIAAIELSAPLHIGLPHQRDQIGVGLSADPSREQHQNECQRRSSHGSPRDWSPRRDDGSAVPAAEASRFAPDYDAIMSGLGSWRPQQGAGPTHNKSPGRVKLDRGWHCREIVQKKLNTERQIAGSIIQA
jgi:hypothetical protein